MVLFTSEHGGACAEQVVVPAESVVPAPAGADFPAASTLLMNALTARLALDAIGAPPGATVAVTGAAGAVGGYAVELAKADGLTVIADAAPRDTELVRGFGADHVVERGAPMWPPASASWYPAVSLVSWTARGRPPRSCPRSPMAGRWPSCGAGPVRPGAASGSAR